MIFSKFSLLGIGLVVLATSSNVYSDAVVDLEFVQNSKLMRITCDKWKRVEYGDSYYLESKCLHEKLKKGWSKSIPIDAYDKDGIAVGSARVYLIKSDPDKFKKNVNIEITDKSDVVTKIIMQDR